MSIASSLSVKKIQSKVWTNKQPSLRWCVQVPSKMGIRFVRVIVSLLMMPKNSNNNPNDEAEWKHNYLLKQKHLLDWKNLLGEHSLKAKAFENSIKFPPSCPSITYPLAYVECVWEYIFFVSKKHTQTKKFPLANWFVHMNVFFPSNNKI